MGKNRKKTQPTGKEEDDEKWAPSITKPVTEDFDAGSEATSKESSSPGVVGPPEILFPPHCTSSEGPARRTRVHSFVLTLHVDLVFLLLLALSLVTRLYRLDYPRNIVFDELHFGKYAQLYNKGVFFFDFQPPLGKQLIALASHLAGFDAGASNFTYSKIGQAYSAEIPVVAMRLIPAVCGSLLPPLMYLFDELHFGKYAQLYNKGVFFFDFQPPLGKQLIALASHLAGFDADNSLLCQSRFILMEPILLCLMLLGFLCLLKFRQRPLFSPSYWGLLLSSAFFLACAFSVKYVAYFSLLCAWYVILRDLWDLIPDQKLSYRTLMAHTIACALAFSVIPLAVYIASFYVHLSTLTKAGHHDSVMTSHFQASLEF
ncbi:unnamed protein product [Cyprideis torosa]|uniref:ArnT-like N-terminal domain-containing protein n=1 Tax=Cyprideis torosa TaxID=163714 RepID=A0A7R8ZU19_9CRUS|nr:unnamed protein product [Cyprideis torosa]CAG0899322.1 unnamed protein product [Cyprideis torosa]